MAKVLFAEPRQAPLLREAEPVAKLLQPGKALGVLLAATDKELRQACAALRCPEAGAAGGAGALMHPLESFLVHLQRLEPARELISGCLNHLLDAPPPKKAGQHPRAVRLLLAAADKQDAWRTVCRALGHILREGDKRLKLAACLVLREVVVAKLCDFDFDPRVSGQQDAAPERQVQAAAQLREMLEPVVILTETFLSIATRDGMVDEANVRGDPLPTRLTTLAADCCIASYIALGRLALLPRPSIQPTVARASVQAVGTGPKITVLSGSKEDRFDDSDASSDEDSDERSASKSDVTAESSGTPDAMGQHLWQALPQMERLLRLLRQWYGGRKV